MSKLEFADLKDEYTHLIATMVVDTTSRKVATINKLVAKIMANQDKYKQVMQHVGGMPIAAIAAIHAMESSCDFTCHLHNGNSLSARTTDVPSGRPPTGSSPFDWVASAVDALTMPHHFLDAVKDWPIERVAYELEKYNGFGYRLQNTGVNTAYLWAWSNHHTKGKFIGDHRFDPSAPSGQPGAMVLIKALADAGLRIDQAGGSFAGGGGGGPTAIVDGMSTAKTKVLETGLFLPSGPFELHATATSPPADDPDVVEEDQPCLKLNEVGLMWEIEVQSDPKRRGFARGGIFKPLVPDATIDIDAFAQMSLNAARFFGTSAQHLVAVADAETGIRNVAAEQGDGVGPFLIAAVDWNAMIADGTTGFNARGRFNPLAQPFVAAKAAVADAKVLQPSLSNRLPTSAELFLAHLIGADHAIKVLSNQAASFQTTVSTEIGATDFAILSGNRPWLFGVPVDVKAAMEKIARRLDFGYDRADGLFARIEPDIGSVAAAGFVGRLCTAAAAEWDFFGDNTFNLAGQTIRAGHREGEPGFFERIGEYWRPLGDMSSDGRTNKPWSAAFISFCVKGAGVGNKFRGSAQHSVYISQAIRDFTDKADVAYWCQRLTDHAPKAGDIICWAREAGVDYDHQKGGDYDGHCDIVVAVRPTEIDVIGGNVGNSVTKRTFALDGGFVKGGTFQGELLFAIMENRLP